MISKTFSEYAVTPTVNIIYSSSYINTLISAYYTITQSNSLYQRIVTATSPLSLTSSAMSLDSSSYHD